MTSAPDGRAPGSEIVDADTAAILARLGTCLETLSGGRVLVTGGRGFLAGYMVQALARANAEGLISPPCTLQLLMRSRPALVSKESAPMLNARPHAAVDGYVALHPACAGHARLAAAAGRPLLAPEAAAFRAWAAADERPLAA